MVNTENKFKAKTRKVETWTVHFNRNLSADHKENRTKVTRTEEQHGNVHTISNGKIEALEQLALSNSWFYMNTLINHFYLQIKVTSM